MCKFSGHSCNKEELFKIAAEDNPFCPHVCCRFCSEKMCGARCNGASEPSFVREWIGDDYLPFIMKSLTNKHGYLIGDIQNYTFENSKDYIVPLEKTVFKNHRQVSFFVDNEIFWLRWPNDGTNGSVLTIKRDDRTVANILTREIIESFQALYNPKLDIAKAPIYHVSLSSVWNECPNCKNTEHIGDTKTGTHGDYYIDYNARCPKCGQLLDWSEEAVEKATKYSKDYLERGKVNKNK